MDDGRGTAPRQANLPIDSPSTPYHRGTKETLKVARSCTVHQSIAVTPNVAIKLIRTAIIRDRMRNTDYLRCRLISFAGRNDGRIPFYLSRAR